MKWEGANPTGSMKDRMALSMIEGAEARGALRPGGRVVDYTGTGGCFSGNAEVYKREVPGARCIAIEPANSRALSGQGPFGGPRPSRGHRDLRQRAEVLAG